MLTQEMLDSIKKVEATRPPESVPISEEWMRTRSTIC